MNTLSGNLLAQLFAQESGDPFLILVTLSHAEFAADITLVNNSVDIISRGITFTAFPMKIRFPVDDGESVREFAIEFDNVGLDLISEIRTVVDPIDIKLELILASLPDDVQMSQEDLKIQNITYTAQKISAKIVMDSFLNTEMTSEKYDPIGYRGLF